MNYLIYDLNRALARALPFLVLLALVGFCTWLRS